MKLKNITFVERHFEKFLIGLTLLVLLVVAYFYVLTGTTVTLNNQTLEPKDVDPAIQRQANSLKQALEAKDDQLPEALKTLEVPEYMQNFAKNLGKRVIPDDESGISFGQPPVLTDNGVLINPDIGPNNSGEPYQVPTIPDPTVVAIKAGMGSVDPGEVQVNAELAKLLPDDAPYDLAWVSVLGRFEMAAMVKQLMKESAPDAKQIPQDWWVGKFGVLDVQMERQELDPATGNWSEPQMVAPMPDPNAVTFRYLPADVEKPEQAAYYLDIMLKNQKAIVQPPFPNLEGKPWSPPEADEPAAVATGDRKADLKKQLKTHRDQIEQIQRQIDRLKNVNATKPATNVPGGVPRPTPGAGTGRTAPAAGAGTGATPGGQYSGTRPVSGTRPKSTSPTATRPSATGAAATTQKDKRIAALTEQLTKVQTEERELAAEYLKLTGEIVPAPAVVPSGVGPGAVPPGIEPRGPGGVPIGPGYPAGFPPGTRPGTLPPGFPAGVTPYGPGMIPSGAPGFPRNIVDPNHMDRVLDVMGGEKLDLYCNDLTVEQGKTYRYRIRVAVVNPLYHKPSLPPDQMKANQTKFEVFSNWTEWTKPVVIEQFQYFFVDSVQPSPYPGQARIEIDRYFQGEWVSHVFAVRAGDPVGGKANASVNGQDNEVDFFTGAYVIDMDFNFEIPPDPKNPNIAKKTQRVLFLTGDQVVARRQDLDKVDKKRKELKETRPVAAAGPAAKP
jgi:hypothetical protein